MRQGVRVFPFTHSEFRRLLRWAWALSTAVFATLAAIAVAKSSLLPEPGSDSAPRAAAEPVPPMTQVASNLDEPEDLIGILQSTAAASGVDLKDVEFRIAASSEARDPAASGALHVRLRQEASYPSSKQFIADLLERLPHVTVSNLSFKQAGPDEGLQAEMRLVVWRQIGNGTAKSTE